jgi:hypothetical protein
MRRRLPWLLVLPLMVAGSLGAHAAAVLLTSGPGAEPGREFVERSSAGAAGHSVVVLGMAAALVMLAGGRWLVSLLRGRPRPGASHWLFFWLPPLAFSVQELLERVLRAEAAPFNAALEPRFLIGLALQIPFGLAALLLAWLLLRVARRIVRALSRTPELSLRRRSTLARPLVGCAPLRIPALALGYPQRGPPAA